MASTATARTHWPDVDSIAREAGLPADAMTIDRTDPIPEHIRAGLDKHLRRMIGHDPGTRIGDDPGELHQMRVSVRRMRALLKSGKTFLDVGWSEPLRAELGWLGRALGPVRDLDVLLDRLHQETADLDTDERAAAARLISGLETEHAQARQDLLAVLDSDRYLGLVSTTADAIRNPLPTSKSDVDGQSALRAMVAKQFRKLRKSVVRPDISDAQLHALRIQGKRLRYTAELAGATNGKRMRRLVAATKRFQDVLGEHQDACVAEERVRGLLSGLGDRADVGVAFVAGRLVERERVRRAERRDQWWSCWLALRECAEDL
jgi:CHAD domain-containing protein